MAYWRLHNLPYPVAQVFAAAVEAASSLGFQVTHLDGPSGHLYLSRPRWAGRRSWPLDLAVTDSGLGTTVLRVSWEPVRASAWPLPPRGRCAGRLCSRIRQILADWNR